MSVSVVWRCHCKCSWLLMIVTTVTLRLAGSALHSSHEVAEHELSSSKECVHDSSSVLAHAHTRRVYVKEEERVGEVERKVVHEAVSQHRSGNRKG